MRNDKLVPGTILVIIGVLFLLNSFNVINFNWWVLWRLWPIFLVIAGINLVFAHNQTGAATAAKVLVLIAGMAFVIVKGLDRNAYRDHNNWNYAFRIFNHRHIFNDNDTTDTDTTDNDRDDDGNTSITKVEGNGHYTEAYKPAVKFARLNISGGATTYTLDGVSNNLFEATTKEYGNKYELKTSADSTTETLDFDMGNGDHHGMILNLGGNKSNAAYLKLNTNPEWEINVEAGATKLNFDLTNFKVRKIKLEGGAGSFHIKMGQPLAETNIEVSTGVSEVTLNIPENAACQIITDTGLSSKHFNGFNSTGDDQYETPNFTQATNKMYIKLSGGISDFKVKRY